MPDDMDSTSKRQRRNFFLYLSPFAGHTYATENGFIPPSADAMEAEVRDVLKLWLTLQQGKAGEMIANSAWWMTRHIDPDNKFTAEEGVGMLDSLTSFAVSTVSLLLNEGVISLNEDVEIPDIMLSTDGFSNEERSDLFFTFEDLLSKFIHGDDDEEEDDDD